MLNLLKNIFTSKTKNEGNLYIQNKLYKDVTLVISKDEIVFDQRPDSEKEAFTSISIHDISDLKLEKNVLCFKVNEKKYKFESPGSPNIYQEIFPMIVQQPSFKTDKIEYYVYNKDTRIFDKIDRKVNLQVYEHVRYYLRIEDENSIIHFEEITTETQYYMDQVNNSFVWSVFNNNSFMTFCIKFEDRLEFLEFVAKYVEFSYKSVNKENKEHVYFKDMASFTNVTPTLAEEEKNEEWSEYEEVESKSNPHTQSIKDHNEHLIVGNNQVFVTRGSSLGVFDLNKEDLEFRTHIQNAFDDPYKIKTHNDDTKLLVLNKEDRNHLDILDLEKGEIVEKWDIEDNMNDYFDSIKYKNDGTLVGVSDFALFRIDPRVKDKIVERNEYKTKNEFSCGIATEKGDVAVASRKGDLRLYNKIDKRAKSLLPGFGDEIIGIDTSKSGSTIVCTCKTYILVFSVHSDFSKNVKDKSAPRRLQLKPQHLSYIKDEISFTPAKFDQNDKYIISSTGRFVVKWKVEDILNGNIYSYSLKALNEKIVDENFVVNGDDIVVALQNDVRKMSESDLKRPNY